MERLGSDELISIYEKLHKSDRESFSRVSNNVLKARCISIRRFYIHRCPRLLNVILPGSPNLRYLSCYKPLSNEHMKLLAQSCPKLEKLDVPCSGLEENLGHPEDYEFDFNDDGLCAVANACRHLYDVNLRGRLHVGDDLGVVSLVRSSKNLRYLDLARCVKITDESLKSIGEATCLKSLSLQGCYLITDLGLEYLANGDLKDSLEFLYLAECVRISDAGIIHLKQMVNLICLDLSKCRDSITDTGIFAIAKLQSIVILRLSWLINVSDTSMFEIANNCLNLETLVLTGCETITCQGLHALADLPKLSYLHLGSCHNISWEDVTSVPFTSYVNIRLSKSIKTTHDDYLRLGHTYCYIHWD